MERHGLLSDTHGNLADVRYALEKFHLAGVHHIIQVGDFGLWPGPRGKAFLVKTHALLKHYDMTMDIILGNHEDYDRVKMMRTDEDGWLYLRDYPLFRFAPRGHTWLIGDVKMAAMGGAGSVDKALRLEDMSRGGEPTWWADEQITRDDVELMRANFTHRGWDRADIMITHDAPAGLRRIGMSPKPAWLTPELEHYAWEQRVNLRDAADIAGPRWIVHGHWHEWARDSYTGVRFNSEDEYHCEVIGLTADGMPRHFATAEFIPGVGLNNIHTWVHSPYCWVPVPQEA